MNMKKSIAGVAAGAMAISAMATVASANVNEHFRNEDATAVREQVVLTYDLATYVEMHNPTVVTIKTTYPSSEYFVKGIKSDYANGKNPNVTGYTVVLGHELLHPKNNNVEYFIQTLEFKGTSMQHPSGAKYPGARTDTRTWYSQNNMDPDFSTNDNKWAAVEAHSQLNVVGDTKGNEWGFQVRFIPGTGSLAGDFLLDEFTSSEGTQTSDVAANITSFPTYAAIKNDQASKGTAATTGKGYTIVAAAKTTAPAAAGKVGISATLNADFTEAKDDNVTANRLLTWVTANLTNNGAPVTSLNGLTAGRWVYWTGNGWDLDPNAVKTYAVSDASAVVMDGVKAGNEVVLPATEAAATVLATANSKIANDNTALQVAITPKDGDNNAANDQPGTAGFAPAAATFVVEASTAAKATDFDYYYLKNADAVPANADVYKLTDTGLADDANANADGVLVIKPSVITGANVLDSTAATTTTNTSYSFETFTVTGTYVVNHITDWDNRKNYEGYGTVKDGVYTDNNVIPYHIGIGSNTERNNQNDADPDSLNSQSAFLGTSNVVGYSGNNTYEMIRPMRSNLQSQLVTNNQVSAKNSGPADVVASLKARKAGGKYYTSPITVLNDVIANNEEVSFKFISSDKKIRNSTLVKENSVRNSSSGKTINIVNPVTGKNELRHVKDDTTYASNHGKYTWGAWEDYYDLQNIEPWKDKDGKITNWGYAVDGSNADKFDWYNPVFSQHLYGDSSYITDYSINGTTYAVSADGVGHGFASNGAVDGAYVDGNAIALYGNYYANNSVVGNYGSYNYGGWNTNLFNGGLVINSVWTMQLSDTKHFDWGQNSLTFFWSDIKANTKSVADQFLVSMLLYTPVEWYWDTLEVGVGAAAAEGGNVAMGAGQDDDGEEIADEAELTEELDVDEDDYFDDYDEEDYTEDEDFGDEDLGDEDFGDEDEYFDDFGDEDFGEEDNTEEEETVVVVEEVASPKTGNSPIALAVIPVALAAAAIVAKKKND